jgi:hypothetical protein
MRFIVASRREAVPVDAVPLPEQQADPKVQDPRWLEGVESAIREQRYSLISPDWGETLPDDVRRRLSADISESYAPTPGTAWWVRKGP